MSKPDMILFLDGSRGIYIPQAFAESIKLPALSGLRDGDTLDILRVGPDHEFYWEAWEHVLNNATVTDDDGVEFSVYQDGDCWLVPKGMEWSDEEDGYVWPSEEDEHDGQPDEAQEWHDYDPDC